MPPSPISLSSSMRARAAYSALMSQVAQLNAFDLITLKAAYDGAWDYSRLPEKIQVALAQVAQAVLNV